MSDQGKPMRVRRSKYRRRRRIQRTAFVFAGLLLLYLGGWWAFSVHSAWFSRVDTDQADLNWMQGNLSENLSALAAKSVALPLSLPRRVVYPYSVIPGGVQTPEDLRQVSDHDRLIGGHYAGFDFRNARIIEVDQPKLVYVSYRMGDKIFWTAKKISLHKGEKLITDGKITARARCANQVSEKAQPAISPAEPPAAAFEMPFDGTAAQIPFPSDLNALMTPHEGSGLGPATSPIQTASTAPFPGGGGPPIYPPPIPSKGCPPGETGGPGKPCHHKPPPPPVPEPATVLLVSSGIAGIYLRRRKAR